MNAATIDAFLAKHDASLVISRAWAHLEAGSPAASLSTNVPAPRRAAIALRGYCLLQRGLGSDWAEAVAAATRVSVARSAPSSPPPPPLPQAAAAVAASEESDALTPEQLAVCGEFILERARALRSDFAAASAAAAASAGDATSAASGELTARQRTCMAQAEALIASAASSVSFFPNALYD